MELRLPGVNLPRLCGRVRGVKSCHGDMSAALWENIGLPRRHGTCVRGKKSCRGVVGAALHQRAGFPVTPGSAFAPTAAVSQTQLPRLPSAPSEPGLGRGHVEQSLAAAIWAPLCGHGVGDVTVTWDVGAWNKVLPRH